MKRIVIITLKVLIYSRMFFLGTIFGRISLLHFPLPRFMLSSQQSNILTTKLFNQIGDI